MVAHVLDALDPDEAAGVIAGAPAHAGDQEIGVCEPLELCPGRLGNGGQLRSRHDRGQRPVDVENDGAPPGSVGERGKESYGLHRPA